MHARPETDEYAEYYGLYIKRVPGGNILELLDSELQTTTELLRGLTPEQAAHRYAEGKWSIKEVMGHVIDAERMFAYRAHCFARRDPAHLPSFEQNDYAEHSNADRREMSDLVDELAAVRKSHVALFRSLDDAMWSYRGIGSGCEFTVRALAYIIVGHEIHHRSVIAERYLTGS